jgi:diguanylate cyclase (GGDEF)-like protein
VTGRVSITALTPLLLPAGLFLCLAGLLASSPVSATWVDFVFFRYMPYTLLAVAALLGVSFSQSRILFISVLIALIALLIDSAYFVKHDPGRAEVVILLSCIYVPSLMALFYFLNERGTLSVHGCVRIVFVLSGLLVVVVLPLASTVKEAVSSVEMALFRPRPPTLMVPAIAVVMLAVCASLLLVRKKHESPFLGPLLCIALLHFFSGLNFRSNLWHAGQERSVLLAFMSGSGFTLAWAVMESSWRSMHLDELTELPGRRSLKHHLARLGSSYAIAVVDLDHFKKINDRYGHNAGDQVLRYVATCLKNNTAGKAYRFGGEEFAIICEGQDFDAMVVAMEDVRKAIEEKRFEVRRKSRPRRKSERARIKTSDGKSKAITLSVSIGVAGNSDRYDSPQEVFVAADKALYRAKKAGRNCVKTAK